MPMGINSKGQIDLGQKVKQDILNQVQAKFNEVPTSLLKSSSSITSIFNLIDSLNQANIYKYHTNCFKWHIEHLNISSVNALKTIFVLHFAFECFDYTQYGRLDVDFHVSIKIAGDTFSLSVDGQNLYFNSVAETCMFFSKIIDTVAFLSVSSYEKEIEKQLDAYDRNRNTLAA